MNDFSVICAERQTDDYWTTNLSPPCRNGGRPTGRGRPLNWASR
jgi:hypothetical protein